MKPEIENSVLQIIRDIVSVRHPGFEPDMDMPLLGGPVEIDEIDYVYIIARLKDAYCIDFVPEDFEQYALNSVSAMATCVRRHLER